MSRQGYARTLERPHAGGAVISGTALHAHNIKGHDACIVCQILVQSGHVAGILFHDITMT